MLKIKLVICYRNPALYYELWRRRERGGEGRERGEGREAGGERV